MTRDGGAFPSVHMLARFQGVSTMTPARRACTLAHTRTHSRAGALRMRVATRTTIWHPRYFPNPSSLYHMFHQQLFHITSGRNRTSKICIADRCSARIVVVLIARTSAMSLCVCVWSQSRRKYNRFLQTLTYTLSSTSFKIGVRVSYKSNSYFVLNAVTPTVGIRRR